MKMSVLAVVMDHTGQKFLAIKRRDVPIWVFPGGGVDEGEQPENAIIREVLEETGLKVSIKRKIAEYFPVNNLTTLTHLYECSILEGEPTTGAETREIGFFDLNFPPKKFFLIHRDMLEDILVKDPNIIIKPFDQVTYWTLFKYFLGNPSHVLRFICTKIGLPINSK